MTLKSRILSFAVALAATGAIASQLPLSGETALAANKCTGVANKEYRVVQGASGNYRQLTANQYNLANGRTFSAYLFDGQGANTYQDENSTFTLSGGSYTFTGGGTTTTGTQATIAPGGTGPATLTVTSLSDPRLQVTVTIL